MSSKNKKRLKRSYDLYILAELSFINFAGMSVDPAEDWILKSDYQYLQLTILKRFLGYNYSSGDLRRPTDIRFCC